MSIKMNAASAAAILAALAVIPAVSAHGHVKSITANGETVAGTTPEWIYNESNTPGWYAKNQDNGEHAHVKIVMYVQDLTIDS